MRALFRYFMFLLCGIQLLFAAGFAFQVSLITDLWPLPYTEELTYIFVGSIFAAGAVSTLWCLLACENGAFAGIGLDYLTILVPISVFSFQLSRGRGALASFALVSALGALFGVGLLLWSLRIPIQDRRRMPTPVRTAFFLFVIALVIVGGSLVTKMPNPLPWNVMTDARVLYGWMFIGAAAYFAYGLLRPSWHNSAGQLAGFLAYDVVLIIPFLRYLPVVSEAMRPNLIIYILVIVASGILAAYYLFLNPATRFRQVRTSKTSVMNTAHTSNSGG